MAGSFQLETVFGPLFIFWNSQPFVHIGNLANIDRYTFLFFPQIFYPNKFPFQGKLFFYTIFKFPAFPLHQVTFLFEKKILRKKASKYADLFFVLISIPLLYWPAKFIKNWKDLSRKSSIFNRLIFFKFN